MITNLDEALEQNKRLVVETFRVTQEFEKTKAELIVLKDKMNSQPSLPVNVNPFYRNVSDNNEFVEKLANAEAALKNSEEMNLKLIRNQREMEKQSQDKEKHSKEMNLKMLTALGQFKTKEDEISALKARLALYDNKEGIKQKIDELTAQLSEKETMLGIVWEEVKTKDNLLANAIKSMQKMSDERRIILEHSQKLKSLMDNNENIQFGNENSLKFMLSEKNKEILQIKHGNQEMADLIIQQGGIINHLEEKIETLELQLQAFNAQPMMQPHSNMQTQQPMMQPNVPAAFMTQVMDNMNKMQMEIQRLNQQNMQPRK